MKKAESVFSLGSHGKASRICQGTSETLDCEIARMQFSWIGVCGTHTFLQSVIASVNQLPTFRYLISINVRYMCTT